MAVTDLIAWTLSGSFWRFCGALLLVGAVGTSISAGLNLAASVVTSVLRR